MARKASPIVGIDLGTSNSALAWFSDGQPELVAGAGKQYLTPSVVGVDDKGRLLVGEVAKSRLVSHPHLTIASFKRYMGTDKTFRLAGRDLRAEELSALVLRKLKTDAEVALGCPISRAAIAVPAYFNDVQRKAVKAAGQLAGLEVERLINEPTAAALAYGLSESRAQKFLVFDLGGGTFDVSIVDMFEGVIEVRASSGDIWLGGDDFTDAIRQWMVTRHPELSLDDPALAAVLTDRAGELKQLLSVQDTADVELIHSGVSYQWTLDNNTFAECCNGLLNRLKKPVFQAMRDARFEVSQLDHIILVGGATRMPIVRQLVTRMFGRFPRNDLNPDEVVALGTGVQAGLMAEDRALDDIVLTDVMPHSLGVAVSRDYGDKIEDGFFCPLIERNAFVPVSVMQTFNTLYDNQSAIEIEIYQGEGRRVSDNLLLGSMTVYVPRRKAGEVCIDTRFTYTLDGILEVECKVHGDDGVSKLVIEKAPGTLSQKEIAARLKRLDGLKQHPRDVPENRQLLAQAGKRYEQTLGERRQAIDRYVALFELALDRQDLRMIAMARDELRQTLARFGEGL